MNCDPDGIVPPASFLCELRGMTRPRFLHSACCPWMHPTEPGWERVGRGLQDLREVVETVHSPRRFYLDRAAQACSDTIVRQASQPEGARSLETSTLTCLLWRV